MSGREREHERLRGLLRELHESDPPAPPYRSPAGAPGGDTFSARAAASVRIVRTRAFARAAWAAAAAAAVVVVAFLALRARTGAPTEDELVRLAASFSSFEAPTDFLLSTPGEEFLESAPRLGTPADTLSGDPTDLLQYDLDEQPDDPGEMEDYE